MPPIATSNPATSNPPGSVGPREQAKRTVQRKDYGESARGAKAGNGNTDTEATMEHAKINGTDKHELLMRFVQKHDGYRSHLTNPIRRNGYLYATNGHISVRIPDDETVSASESTEAQNLESVFVHGDIEFHPLPALPDAIKCKHCDGTGVEYLADCDDCDGDGEFRHGHHFYDCKECGGEGKVKAPRETTNPTTCWHCSGSGEADYREGSLPIKIGELHFQPHLLRMIATLPNARIEHVTPKDARTLPAAHFVFDGGEGAIMPIKVQP